MTLYYRKYDSYKEYVKHQSSKLDKMLKKKNKSTQKVRPECFFKRVRYFQSNLEKFCPYMVEGKLLCLGARTGAEVKAFMRLGFKDSIGIDLNPGKDNPYVIKGDFHNMPFKDSSFNNVFTNSLDHIFDIRKLSREVNRVLVNGGKLIMEISHFLDFNREGRKKQLESGKIYESFCFDDFKDIENGFKEFKLKHTEEFQGKKIMVVFENIK